MNNIKPQNGDRVEWIAHGGHYPPNKGTWGVDDIPRDAKYLEVVLPFLVVKIRKSFSDDFGNSVSMTSENCIAVRTIEEGERLAAILTDYDNTGFEPLRLMYPNKVIKEYAK